MAVPVWWVVDAGETLMGSALCGGPGPWPPLPPDLQAAYDQWVEAGKPGLEEASEVVAIEEED